MTNMEPTTEQKNVAIAEMLEWKQVDWFAGTVFMKPHAPELKLPKDYILTRDNFRFSHSAVSSTELKFHSDANWQYEAIEYLHKNHHVHYRISHGHCWLWDTTNESQVPIIIDRNDTKVAVFEALYQFSQYLKQKK